MDIKLEEDEKEVTTKLQNVVNRINANNQAIQQIQAQNNELVQEARRLEGELRLLKRLKDREDGTKEVK